ncbi:hypothetical protein RND71_039894 [Anisodus tanguticus]|uniref:Uncharacterized protein n=1 Tax=Anisodus tanguticus TaxID=243964 RepID=A0AAE1UR23_9SOLA|nr:hypothetical protein RND71_039894 [Anisodus tanguticus]
MVAFSSIYSCITLAGSKSSSFTNVNMRAARYPFTSVVLPEGASQLLMSYSQNFPSVSNCWNGIYGSSLATVPPSQECRLCQGTLPNCMALYCVHSESDPHIIHHERTLGSYKPFELLPHRNLPFCL